MANKKKNSNYSTEKSAEKKAAKVYGSVEAVGRTGGVGVDVQGAKISP